MVVRKDRVQLLVDALVSGDFVQGKGVLSRAKSEALSSEEKEDVNNFAHCCLGVACIVAMRNGLEIEKLAGPRLSAGIDNSTVIVWGADNAGASDTNLPLRVQEWYGFLDSDPGLRTSTGVEQEASYLNDDVGLSFDEIAEAFRETYLTPEEGA